MGFSRRISRIIAPAQPVPNEYRANFIHLYLDVFWYGVLNGSTLSFLTIFATRQGANGMQAWFNQCCSCSGYIDICSAGQYLAYPAPNQGWSVLVWSGFSFVLPISNTLTSLTHAKRTDLGNHPHYVGDEYTWDCIIGWF